MPKKKQTKKAKNKPVKKAGSKKPRVQNAKEQKEKTLKVDLRWSLKKIEEEAKNNELLRDALALYKRCRDKKVRRSTRALIQDERRAAAERNAREQKNAPSATKSEEEEAFAALLAKQQTTLAPATLPPPILPATATAPRFPTDAPSLVSNATLAAPKFKSKDTALKVKSMPAFRSSSNRQRETTPRYWGELVDMHNIPEERYTFNWHCFGNSRKTGEPCQNNAMFGAAWDGVCCPLLLGFPFCEKHLSQYGGPEMSELYCKLCTPSQAARFRKNNGPSKF